MSAQLRSKTPLIPSPEPSTQFTPAVVSPIPSAQNLPDSEPGVDRFVTLFSPPTPPASPIPSPAPIPPSVGPTHQPIRAPSRSGAVRSTSTDSDFGSFVSVLPTEDPLASTD